MKTLTFTQPHHLGKLHEELLAAVPSVQPVGSGDERRAVMTVSGDGKRLELRVPDTADEAAIRSVVAAHDASPPAPPPDPNEELDAAIAAATTLEELKDALRGMSRPGRVAGRPA